MLLRNLFESDWQTPNTAKVGKYQPLSPGDKRELKIRITNLKEKYDELHQYHMQLQSFVQDVPPGMEEDLKELERVYMQAIADETAKLKSSVQDTHVYKFLDGIKVKCSDAVDAMRKAQTFLYRGTSNRGDVYIGKPHTDRRVMTSTSSVQKVYDELIAKAGFKALRGNSIFTSGDSGLAFNFGSSRYLIFPVNGFDFTWSTTKRDIVIDSGSMKEWINRDKARALWGEIFNNETNRKRFLELIGMGYDTNDIPYDMQYDLILTYDGFLGSYRGDKHFEAMQQMAKEGLLKDPPEKTSDLIDPQSVVNSMSLRHDDFVAALKAEHEICIHGTYYAINYAHMDTVAQFLRIGREYPTDAEQKEDEDILKDLNYTPGIDDDEWEPNDDEDRY